MLTFLPRASSSSSLGVGVRNLVCRVVIRLFGRTMSSEEIIEVQPDEQKQQNGDEEAHAAVDEQQSQDSKEVC